jgi:hypothetical protein
MSLVIPQFLWDNTSRRAGASVAYQGAAENVRFPLANALDWKDWTLFEVQTGTTDLVIRLPYDFAYDSWAWFVKSPTAGADGDWSMRPYWESAPGVFSPLTAAGISPRARGLGMESFASQVIPANRAFLLRFIVPAGQVLYVRQVAQGASLIPPIGQQVGIAPPSLQQSWKLSNGMSVNGSLISRSLVRLVKEYNVDLEYLTPAFCSDTWAPLCTHALKYPFFFRWSPRNYPLDCLFAAASSVPAPEYQKPHLMRAKMPLVGLTQ